MGACACVVGARGCVVGARGCVEGVVLGGARSELAKVPPECMAVEMERRGRVPPGVACSSLTKGPEKSFVESFEKVVDPPPSGLKAKLDGGRAMGSLDSEFVELELE